MTATLSSAPQRSVSRDLTSEFLRHAKQRRKETPTHSPAATLSTRHQNEDSETWRPWFERILRVGQGLMRTHSVMVESAPGYLSTGRFLGPVSSTSNSSGAAAMTETERDDYERAMHKSLDATAHALDQLSNALPRASSGYHKYSAVAHRVTIVLVLQGRLKNLRAAFTQQQLSRAKAAWAQSELFSAAAIGGTTTFDKIYSDDDDNSETTLLTSDAGAMSGGKTKSKAGKLNSGFGFDTNEAHRRENSFGSRGDALEGWEGEEWGGVEDELDESQIQMFEAENLALVEQLKTEVDAVQKVERNVHQLISMMDTFNQHLVEQQATLREVGLDVEVSMTNVESAVPQLESAKKHGSTLARRFSAFVVASAVALLAVDWVTY